MTTPAKKKGSSAKTEATEKPQKRENARIIVADGAQVVDAQDVPNEALIDKAIQNIGEILDRTVKQSQVEVGEYLFREFYDDNEEEYRSKNPKKAVSLNALLDKCGSFELPVSRTFLQNSISVAIALKQLGSGSEEFLSLPPSHKVALLPVDDPARIKVLAKRAADEKMTVRDLREEVKAELLKTKGKSKAGRPPIPNVEKAVNAVVKALVQKTGKMSFKKGDIRGMKPESADAVKGNVKNIISGLEDLLTSLEKEYPKE